ncbi:hypothetical protein BDQ17DRAFT_1429522 [Cyathus striatus]|nr:hypothetical protein BDQ17DRAFT_1429522 [Cyathus striatus]
MFDKEITYFEVFIRVMRVIFICVEVTTGSAHNNEYLGNIKLTMVKLTAIMSLFAVGTVANAFSFDAYSSTNYGGTHYGSTSTTGTKNLELYAHSYKWYLTLGDGCCIRFCSGSSFTGYWCGSRVNPNIASEISSIWSL